VDSFGPVILDKLEGARRRAFLTHLVYCLSACLYLLLGIVILSVVYSMKLELPTASHTVTALVLVIGGSIVVALLRAPSLKETAGNLDTKLNLKQRLVTSLQLIDDHDEMSLLLHKDAGVRLGELDASLAFPFRLVAPARPIWGGALFLLGTVLAFRMLGLSGLSLLDPLKSALERGGLQVQSVDVAESVVTQEPEGTPRPTESSGLASEEADPGGSQRSDVDRSAPSSRGARDPLETRKSAPQSRYAETEAEMAKTLTARESRIVTSEIPGQLPGDSKDERFRDESLAVPAEPAEEGRRSRELSQQRAGEDPAGESSGAASPDGGTEAIGDPIPSTPMAEEAMAASSVTSLPGRDREMLERYRRAYPTFWRDAEAVLSQDRIPPGFEKIIRDYFSAIRPEK